LYATADGAVVEMDSIEGHKGSAHQLARQLAQDLHQRVTEKSREINREAEA
jgi:hypothetical protein